MVITVKFFASLRELLDINEETVTVDTGVTVADVWNKATNGADIPTNVLIAVNMDYVGINHKVDDGDEVAFFPPVSGG